MRLRQLIEENESGIAAIAVPVCVPSEQNVIGTISMAGPMQGMHMERLPQPGKMLSVIAEKLDNALEN